MKLEVLENEEALAGRTADVIAVAVRGAIERQGSCALALSGGRGPGPMFRALATSDVDFTCVDLFQVDERVAPSGDPDRNWTLIERELVSRLSQPPRLHPMPVETRDVDDYERDVPRVLDVVHLGVGPDGHTASLIPNDPVLDVTDRFVAMSGPYEGRERMTLTFPALDAATFTVVMVSGAEKAGAVKKMLAHDESVPAGRLKARDVLVLADRAAATD